MNADHFKGKWNQFKGELKKKWGEITDDDLTTVEGNYDKFKGLMQERYADRKDEVSKWADEWYRTPRRTRKNRRRSDVRDASSPTGPPLPFPLGESDPIERFHTTGFRYRLQRQPSVRRAVRSGNAQRCDNRRLTWGLENGWDHNDISTAFR